ncbi:hypothetical protein E3P99_03556 [Wallemia hederae]|uniref:Uncharacterized protein n=1 Tax=Wallemia hederae TaxID=1540922 RepID=A0A4T0FHL6_9BASI|nr:hypothetical protein E3P99_03556 [Wallemia hederae]
MAVAQGSCELDYRQQLTDSVIDSNNDADRKTPLELCYDNSCSDYHKADDDCRSSAQNNATEYYSCSCPAMYDTIQHKGDCVDCLNNAGFNITGQTNLYCEAFGVYNPTQASSFSMQSTASTASTASSSNTDGSNNNNNSNSDDDDSSAAQMGVTAAAAAILLTAVGCLV